jgi:hypothetical protein
LYCIVFSLFHSLDRLTAPALQKKKSKPTAAVGATATGATTATVNGALTVNPKSVERKLVIKFEYW